MVSAVFHTSLDTQAGAKPAPAVIGAKPRPVAAAAVAEAPAPEGFSLDWRAFFMKVLPPLAGIALLVGIWALATMNSTTFPTPAATFTEAVKVFSDPFYSKGPNDQGIGWNILFSLERVAVGFGLAALVGIPAGFLIGRFKFLDNMASPLISLLRPVSPLAWLPIGLLVFKGADPAAIWTIFICSIWPMII
ncbi:MAG: nitrate ABC transporter, permease protein, partial [Pseudomonadota bacterium]